MPDLARIAYEAYCRSFANVDLSGNPTPAYDELADVAKQAWDAAAQAVASTLL